MSISPSTKSKVGLSVVEIKFLAKGNKLTYNEVLTLIHDMLLYVLSELIFELEIWIKNKVPKRTGQLRDSLLETLHTSDVVSGELNLKLGTMLFYAEDVAAMSTMQVRHSGEASYAYYYGHRGKIMLEDPQAIGNFWDELQRYSKERLMNILQRAIDEYFKGTGKLMREVRGRV